MTVWRTTEYLEPGCIAIAGEIYGERMKERVLWEAGYTAGLANAQPQWAIEQGGKLLLENDRLRARLAASETRIIDQQARIAELEAALLLAQETRRTFETTAANLAAGETGWRQEVARLEAWVEQARAWAGLWKRSAHDNRLRLKLCGMGWDGASELNKKLLAENGRLVSQQLQPEQTAVSPAYDARAWAKAWKRSARYWREVVYRMAGGNGDGDDWDSPGSLGAKAVVEENPVVETTAPVWNWQQIGFESKRPKRHGRTR